MTITVRSYENDKKKKILEIGFENAPSRVFLINGLCIGYERPSCTHSAGVWGGASAPKEILKKDFN